MAAKKKKKKTPKRRYAFMDRDGRFYMDDECAVLYFSVQDAENDGDNAAMGLGLEPNDRLRLVSVEIVGHYELHHTIAVVRIK